MYDIGHKKIAFIQGDKGNFIGKSRLQGYLDFIKDHNLEEIYCKDIINISYSFDDGLKTMQCIYDNFGLPEAIVSSSDLMAIGAMKYIQQIGYKVPEDVSIIGFDDLQLCEIVTPKLSSIRQDYELIGKKSCELLIEKMNKKAIKLKPFVVDTQLILRESVRKRIDN